MANPNEMSKTEMRLEINAAEAVVNNGGTLSQEQWDRVFKMLQLVKEDYTMKKKELRGHLGMLAFSMDSQWCVMHREDLPEPTRVCAEGQYQGMIFTLTALGGDWVRDDKGKHRAFLMGESSRDTDEYTNKED